jgi:hypothetical protein
VHVGGNVRTASARVKTGAQGRPGTFTSGEMLW